MQLVKHQTRRQRDTAAAIRVAAPSRATCSRKREAEVRRKLLGRVTGGPWGVCGIYSPDPFGWTLGWKSSFKVNLPGGGTSKMGSDPNTKRLLRPCVTVRDAAWSLPWKSSPRNRRPAAPPLAAPLMHGPRGDPEGRAFVPP